MALRTDVVLDALEQAIYDRCGADVTDVVHHSDPSSQYLSMLRSGCGVEELSVSQLPQQRNGVENLPVRVPLTAANARNQSTRALDDLTFGRVYSDSFRIGTNENECSPFVELTGNVGKSPMVTARFASLR